MTRSLLIISVLSIFVLANRASTEPTTLCNREQRQIDLSGDYWRHVANEPEYDLIGGAEVAGIFASQYELKSVLNGGDETPVNSYAELAPEYAISGDFDIMVDYQIETAPSSQEWILFLRAYSLENSLNKKANSEIRASIHHRFDRTSLEYGGESRYNGLPGTIEGTGDYTQARQMTGRLRVIRVGDIGMAYYWDGSRWSQIHRGQIDDSDYGLMLWQHRSIGQDFAVTFSNLEVYGLNCP